MCRDDLIVHLQCAEVHSALSCEAMRRFGIIASASQTTELIDAHRLQVSPRLLTYHGCEHFVIISMGLGDCEHYRAKFRKPATLSACVPLTGKLMCGKFRPRSAQDGDMPGHGID